MFTLPSTSCYPQPYHSYHRLYLLAPEPEPEPATASVVADLVAVGVRPIAGPVREAPPFLWLLIDVILRTSRLAGGVSWYVALSEG